MFKLIASLEFNWLLSL